MEFAQAASRMPPSQYRGRRNREPQKRGKIGQPCRRPCEAAKCPCISSTIGSEHLRHNIQSTITKKNLRREGGSTNNELCQPIGYANRRVTILSAWQLTMCVRSDMRRCLGRSPRNPEGSDGAQLDSVLLGISHTRGPVRGPFFSLTRNQDKVSCGIVRDARDYLLGTGRVAHLFIFELLTSPLGDP